jgi:hypothetical protein
LWKDVRAFCKKWKLRTCSLVEPILRKAIRELDQIFSEALSENERSDRLERKKRVLLSIYSLHTQTNETSVQSKTYRKSMGNIPKRHGELDGDLPGLGVCEVGGCCEPAFGEVVYGQTGERHWVCRGHFELFRREGFVDRGIFKGSARALS